MMMTCVVGRVSCSCVSRCLRDLLLGAVATGVSSRIALMADGYVVALLLLAVILMNVLLLVRGSVVISVVV